MSKVFSERLSLLRKERYSSQKEGAEALGISISRYNKWENDTNRPDYETVCTIANHYGVTTDYLLGRTESRSGGEGLLLSDLGLTRDGAEWVKEMAYIGREHKGLVWAIGQALRAFCETVDKTP